MVAALRGEQTTLYDSEGEWVMVIGLGKERFEDDEEDST